MSLQVLRSEWQPPPDDVPSPNGPSELPASEPEKPTYTPDEIPSGPDEVPQPRPSEEPVTDEQRRALAIKRDLRLRHRMQSIRHAVRTV